MFKKIFREIDLFDFTIFFVFFFQNGEMLFNFGDQPWKYPPLEGYIGFAQVPSKNIVPNTKKSSATQTRKIVNNAPQALIIEPSRELAEQTFEQIKKFKKHLDSPNIRELLVVGGIRVDDQIRALEAGVDIVVATPGNIVGQKNS